MKKFAALLLALVLCIPAFALADEAEYTTVTIGATPSPRTLRFWRLLSRSWRPWASS